MTCFKLTVLFFIFFFISFSGRVLAQDNKTDIEERVQAVENYIEGFQPALNKFSEDMQNTVHTYNQGLESNLNKYYIKLRDKLDQRLSTLDNRIIVLDTSGKTFQRVDTDAGMFLVSIEKKELIENGIRLHMNIGNINFADFSDYKIKLVWGKKWTGGEAGDSYAAWRESLTGAEFSFQGALIKGVWNPVKIDLVPADSSKVEYIECGMSVSAVILEHK